MGWIREDRTGHEGYMVGYVVRDGCTPGSRLYRELGYPESTEREDIHVIGAGCECGWRSPYFTPREGYAKDAPLIRYPSWSPYTVWVDERDEDRGRQLWAQHMETPHEL